MLLDGVVCHRYFVSVNTGCGVMIKIFLWGKSDSHTALGNCIFAFVPIFPTTSNIFLCGGDCGFTAAVVMLHFHLYNL